jgi:hypothetical protein
VHIHKDTKQAAPIFWAESIGGKEFAFEWDACPDSKKTDKPRGMNYSTFFCADILLLPNGGWNQATERIQCFVTIYGRLIEN